MTYQELKQKATLIGEDNIMHNGVYGGDIIYYLYDNDLYARYEPTNAFQYDGKTRTELIIDNVKNAFNKYNYSRFCGIINRDIYEKLCNYYNINPTPNELLY